jgi:hypothetical protein
MSGEDSSAGEFCSVEFPSGIRISLGSKCLSAKELADLCAEFYLFLQQKNGHKKPKEYCG